MGGTGHWPVPGGDPPLGTGSRPHLFEWLFSLPTSRPFRPASRRRAGALWRAAGGRTAQAGRLCHPFQLGNSGLDRPQPTSDGSGVSSQTGCRPRNLASDWVKSVADWVKSVIDLTQIVTDFTQTVADLTLSGAELTQTVTDFTLSVIDLTLIMTDFTLSVADLTQTVTDFTLSVIDLTQIVTDFTLSVADLTQTVTDFTLSVTELTQSVTKNGRFEAKFHENVKITLKLSGQKATVAARQTKPKPRITGASRKSRKVPSKNPLSARTVRNHISFGNNASASCKNGTTPRTAPVLPLAASRAG